MNEIWEVSEKKSTDSAVKKYIFQTPEVIAESVLYAYPTYDERTVMCISTQSGCPMGCTFCGTGKFFARNLSTKEITEQVRHMVDYNAINTKSIDKFQIMFMSMGEPILNTKQLVPALIELHDLHPNAQLLISTSAPSTNAGWDDFMKIAQEIDAIGLQFSVHESLDENRNKIMPMKNKLNLEEIAKMGVEFFRLTSRKPFFNYCAHEGNSSAEDAMRLRMLFDPRVWECTLSVICEKDSNMKDTTNEQVPLLESFSSKLVQLGFNTRLFNPAGTDDIGGGCGQLHQVQQFAKLHPNIMKQSPGYKILNQSEK